jgi:Tol biopolymer transport system component
MLTDNRGDDNPALSPDGSILAFTRQRGGGADLYLLRLGEGYKPQGEPEKVSSGSPEIIGVAWTPDGRDIVACDRSSTLWRIAASAPGKATRLAFASDTVSDVTISRRGNRLAYALEQRESDIYRIDLAGPGLNPGIPFKFISSTRLETGPSYSPDGKKIAFYSDRSGAWEVWVCDRDGSNAVQLTSLGGEDIDGSAWSPDGRSIAFGLFAGGQQSLFVVSASGGVPRSLANNPAYMFRPHWSRDGQIIYFQSTRSGISEIWKMPAAGGDAVQITPNGKERVLPQVSADGKFLFYERADRYPEECSVWRMPVGGGEETMVLDSTPCHPPFAVWKQGIYFFTKPDSQGRQDLTLYDFLTGSRRKILTIEEPGSYIAVSPDGRAILYTRSVYPSDLMLVENFR